MTNTPSGPTDCVLNHCHAQRRHPERDDAPADGLCHMPAGWRTVHPQYGPCKHHLGNSPNVIRSCYRRMLADDVAAMGLRTDVNAIEALTEDMQWTHGTLAHLRAVIGAMEDDELWGDRGKVVRAWYDTQQDHLTKVTMALTRTETAKIYGRYVGQQMDLLERGAAWLLTRLGVWDQPETQRLFDQMLLALAEGQVPELEGPYD